MRLLVTPDIWRKLAFAGINPVKESMSLSKPDEDPEYEKWMIELATTQTDLRVTDKLRHCVLCICRLPEITRQLVRFL